LDKLKVWLKGLLAATISAAASSITVYVSDPEKFNFDSGWDNLLSIIAISAIVGAALYLMKSPVPD